MDIKECQDLLREGSHFLKNSNDEINSLRKEAINNMSGTGKSMMGQQMLKKVLDHIYKLAECEFDIMDGKQVLNVLKDINQSSKEEIVSKINDCINYINATKEVEYLKKEGEGYSYLKVDIL